MIQSSGVEYFFLCYVPDPVSHRSVSIAVILIDPCDLEKGVCTMSSPQDWKSRVWFLDPDSDLEMLEALMTEIRDRLRSSSERSEMIQQLEDSFSNVIQVSRRRKCPFAPTPETASAFARQLLQTTSKTRRFAEM